MANNVPGYGYATVPQKDKIYTAFTGLFGSSPLFATASYGNTEAPIPFLTYPYSIKLSDVSLDIDQDTHKIVIKTAETPIVWSNIFRDDRYNKIPLPFSLPAQVRFNLSGNYAQKWGYTGILETLESPIVINNLIRVYGNGKDTYPSNLNYQSTLDIYVYLPKGMSN